MLEEGAVPPFLIDRIVAGNQSYGCFPPLEDPDAIRSAVFDACYRSHGGSGSNLTVSEAWSMPWEELMWWLEKLRETREAESDAIRAAHRR